MSEVATEPPTDDARPKCYLKLFVADGEPNSAIACTNLKRLQGGNFDCELVVDVVDVLENYQAALNAHVLVTPCLVMQSPTNRVVVVGTLSDRQKVISAIGLVEQAGGQAGGQAGEGAGGRANLRHDQQEDAG